MMRLTRFEEQEVELKKRMRALKIYFKDIKEQFVRSSGPGGQNVNKVSTCVVLRHVPTGIIVKCQKERTQAANRHEALLQLVRKIEKQIHDAHVKEQQLLAKKKRQSRKKPQPLKEAMLEEKHKNSEKKKRRKKINITDIDE